MASPSTFSSPSFHTTAGSADTTSLNNAASLLIERGHYDMAIASLQQALRQVELRMMNESESNTNRTKIYCMCNECTIDGCIQFSEKQNISCNRAIYQTHRDVHTDSSCSCSNNCAHTEATKSSNKRRRITQTRRDDGEETANIYSNDKESGYIYQRPILIPNDHEMGATRFSVVLFNLALAHQLKAVSSKSKNSNSSNTNNKSEIENETPRDNECTRKALLLYEILFEYWSRLQSVSSNTRSFDAHKDTARSTSFRFVMIMYNNLSQMYSLVDDTIRQHQCLQSLLSIVMIAIESKNRNTGSLFAPRGPRTIQNSTNSDINSSASFQESLDGFLANTATLIVSQKMCAQAA